MGFSSINQPFWIHFGSIYGNLHCHESQDDDFAEADEFEKFAREMKDLDDCLARVRGDTECPPTNCWPGIRPTLTSTASAR